MSGSNKAFQIKALKFVKRFYPIIFFVALSILPFFWFSSSPFPAAGSDSGLIFFGYNSGFLLKSYMYVWADLSEALGSYHAYHVLFIPWALFMHFLSFAGINGHYREVAIYALILFFSMYFFYNFILELFYNVPRNKIISLVSSIFFVFNLYIMSAFSGFTFTVFALPFLSSCFYFILKGIKTLDIKYVLYLNIAILLSSIILSLIQVSLPIIFFLGLFIIFYGILYLKEINVKAYIKYVFILLLFTALINCWWIFPYIFSLFKEYDNFRRNYDLVNYLKTVSSYINIISNFTTPYSNPIFKSLNLTSEWQYLVDYYSNSIIKIFSYLFFGIIITAFFVINTEAKKNKLILFFYFLFIIALFLILGYNKPFGFIFLGLFRHIPFFSGFASVYTDFIFLLLFSYSVLFAVGIKYIINSNAVYILKNRFILILVFAVGYYLCLYPFFIGKMVVIPNQFLGNNKNQYYTANVFVKIPKYYKSISNFFYKKKIYFNTLTLPISWGNYRNFAWKKYFHGQDLSWLLYRHSTISSYHSNRYSYCKMIYDLQKNKFHKIFLVSSLMSIKYIIIQNDAIINNTNSEIHQIYLPKKDLPIILKKEKFNFIKRFGRLDLYSLPNKYYLNFIYIPTNIIYSPKLNSNRFLNSKVLNYNPIEGVLDIAKFPDYKIRTIVLFSQLNRDKNNVEINSLMKKLNIKTEAAKTHNRIIRIKYSSLNTKPPIVEFRRINPTKYIVFVYNARANFPIVLNQRYSYRWNLYPEKYRVIHPNSRLYLNYQCKLEKYSNCMNLRQIKYNVKKGNISYIGDKFISKDINGTIQNDNIPSGHILQTLIQSPYPGKYHFVANGYANAWWININKIKKLSPEYYHINKNGTYDFKFIIDFWPQRLFYIGIIISGTTVILFGLYLIYDAIKKRKTR